MTDHYRKFAVSVDPQFARELKAQLDARRVGQHGSPEPVDDQAIQRPRITEVPLVLQPDKQPDHTWRRVGLLAAAAVVAVGAGTVLVLATADDDADPRSAATLPSERSTPATVAPPSALEAQEAIGLAQGFVKARDAWDGEAVRALVADDAVIADAAISNADDYLLAAEFERATGWRYMQPECTATVLDAPVEVTCTYTMQNAWSQAIGRGPFTGSFELVIADGHIQQITHDFDWNQFSAQVFGVFAAWLTNSYPNDNDVMWDSSTGNAHLTPEAIALWEQHTTEFEAVRPGVNFVEARSDWDGEAVRALVADDAVIDDFAVTNADDYLALAEIEQATRWRYMQPECTATVPEPPITVTCTYTMQNAWSLAIGVGPFTGSSFEFVIADGQIRQIAHHFNYTVFDPQVASVFGRWLTDTYPNDLEVMFNSNGTFSLTPESIALFEAHTTEFVSSLNNSGSD